MRSKSLVNITLFLLYMESCCCLTIYRELRDKSDLLSTSNCNGITQTFFEHETRRCKCSISPKASIVSTNSGKISCIVDSNIDSSKYK